MCLSLDAAVPGLNVGLVQTPCNPKDKSQRFAFLHVAGGYYRIMPSARSKTFCWTAPSAPYAHVPVSLERCSDGANVTQEFFLSPVPRSSGWEIKPRTDQRFCLDVEDASPDAGTRIQLYKCWGETLSQRFELPNFNPAKLVQLQKVVTATAAKCITVANKGVGNNFLEQYDCKAYNERITNFIFLSAGAGTYRIASSSDIRKCWTVGGPDPNTIGKRITLEDCMITASNQLFMMVPQEGGWILKAKFNTERCIDVQYAGRTDGTPIWMWECNGTPAQRFLLPGFQPVLQQVVVTDYSYVETMCVDYAPEKHPPDIDSSLLNNGMAVNTDRPLETAPCNSSKGTQKFFFVHGIGKVFGAFYRILSASDFSKCWTAMTALGSPEAENISDDRGLFIMDCDESEGNQQFVLQQDYFTGGWFLQSQVQPGKCVIGANGTLVLDDCQADTIYENVMAHKVLELPGLYP
ncbi:hypothetical protein Vafri_1791 [Volvox africanus]|nr:hypothetical protein Vafri_1791 [Volvox africanus]